MTPGKISHQATHCFRIVSSTFYYILLVLIANITLLKQTGVGAVETEMKCASFLYQVGPKSVSDADKFCVVCIFMPNSYGPDRGPGYFCQHCLERFVSEGY